MGGGRGDFSYWSEGGRHIFIAGQGGVKHIQLGRKKSGLFLALNLAPMARKIGQKISLSGSPMLKLSVAVLVGPIQSVVLEGEVFENFCRKT